MKIQKVIAVNFKGATFEQAFSAPVTVICGRNEMHKSARLEAASLAILGYVMGGQPVKSNRDIFDIYSGASQMSVGVMLDDGGKQQQVTRTWRMSGESVKYDGPKSGLVDNVLLDPEAFFAMSGPERTRYLFRVTEGGGASATDYRNTLVAKLKSIRVEDHSKLHEEAIARAIEVVPAANGGDAVAWIEAAVKAILEYRTLCDQNAKRLVASVAAMAQLSATGAHASGDEEREYQQKLDAIKGAWRDEAKARSELQLLRDRYRTEQAAVGADVNVDALKSEIQQLRDGQDVPTAEDLAKMAEDVEERLLLAQSNERFAKASAAELREKADVECCPACGHRLTAKARKHLFYQADQETAKAEDAAKRVSEVKAEEARVVRLARSLHLSERLASLETSKKMLSELEKLGQDKAKECAKLKTDAECLELESKAFLERVREAVEFRAAQADRMKAVEASETARANFAIAVKAASAMLDFQRETVEGRMAQIMERVNGFCQMLPSPVVFKDGDFGYGSVSRRSISDSTRVVIYSGISVALASASPLKVATIGRFESLDPARQQSMITSALKLIGEKKLEQAIFVMVGTPTFPSCDGVEIVKL